MTIPLKETLPDPDPPPTNHSTPLSKHCLSPLLYKYCSSFYHQRVTRGIYKRCQPHLQAQSKACRSIWLKNGTLWGLKKRQRRRQSQRGTGGEGRPLDLPRHFFLLLETRMLVVWAVVLEVGAGVVVVSLVVGAGGLVVGAVVVVVVSLVVVLVQALSCVMPQ